MSLSEQMAAGVGGSAPQSAPKSSLSAQMASGIVAPSKAAKVNAEPQTGMGNPLDALVGIGETITNGALGAAGALGGGLAEVAGLATGSTDRAQRWNDWVRNNVSTLAGLYDPTPESETGKGIQDVVNNGFEYLKKGAGTLGEKTLNATGSPLAATAVDTGAQALGQAGAAAIGAKGLQLVGRGIFGTPETLGTPLDKGGGRSTQARTRRTRKANEWWWRCYSN